MDSHYQFYQINILTLLMILVLLSIGSIALVFSIFYSSTVMALIGIALIFWGILFSYIRTENHNKKSLVEAITSCQVKTLNCIIHETCYTGSAIYLPPKYFKNLENTKVFIPKQKETPLPTPNHLQNLDNKIFINDPPSILLTPPGATLTKLFEKILETNFNTVDLKYIQKKMPNLLVDHLEIVQGFNIETEKNKIHVIIEKPEYKFLTEEDNYSPLSPILISAIACSLTKVTGKPIKLLCVQIIDDRKIVTVDYEILQESV